MSLSYLSRLLFLSCLQSEDVIVESSESGEDGDETPGETIKELKARKAELRQRVESQARDKQSLQVS
jgi:hypothetical protein